MQMHDDIDMSHAARGDAEEKAAVNAAETKLVLAKRIIAGLRDELANLERILDAKAEEIDMDEILSRSASSGMVAPSSDARIVEGVFDGQNMVGSDGRQYLVPQNYASKSKLVEGDILKLMIQPNGNFIFKQIGPIERERVVGVLIRDENTQEWKVAAEGKKYHVLSASISFFRGQEGDDIVILIPKAAPSKWAAVENVIHQE